MSNELNQQVVNQPQVDDNNTQGKGQQVDDKQSSKPQDSLFSPEELAATQRSQNRNTFFANMKEEDLERALLDAENGIPLPAYEEEQDTEENKSQQEGEQDNGLQDKGQEEEVKSEPKSDLIGGDNTQDKTPQQEQPKVEEYKIKARGKEYDFSLEELKKMASKGIDYTQKLQKIAPYRKMIDAIETNNISEYDINQLIEMKKGNKDAIGAFTKKYNIALSDIEAGEANAASYKPQSYGQEPSALQDIDVELRGSMDATNYKTMIDFVNNADSNSQQFFVDNPEALYILANNINDGSFNRVINEVEKQELLDVSNRRIPLIDRYRKIWLEMNNNQKANMQTNIGSNSVVTQLASHSENQNKDRLGLTGTNNVSIKDEKVINMLDDITDEDFERFFKEKTGMSFNSY